jgi:GAF domain-containing protein/CheY-like chemotaxis protein/anti-sigma regulatory factor (Ser/Thr protein kinase)
VTVGPHASGERRPQPGGAMAAQQALIELAEAAAPGAGLSEVLERVARAAATLVPGSLVHVWLASEDQRELRLVTEIGAQPDHGGAEQCRAVPMDESLLGAVVQSPEPVVVPSLLDDERAVSRAWAQHQSVVSFAGVRLARRDHPLGALCLLTWEPYSFTPLEVNFLRSLGAHAAVAIEAAALLEVASTRLRRLETLREIEGGMSGQRDPDALMATISRRAAELLDADTGGIFLLEGQGVLRLHAAFNWPEWMQSVPIQVGEGAIGVTAARAQGMVVSDFPHSPLALPRSRDVHPALATQPLMAGGALRGVIVVTRNASPCPFTQADLAILADFAVQASIAIENARLLRLASARAERVKAAAEVGQLLAATRDADKILDLIAEKCREVLGAAAFGLFRFDGDRLRYVRGFGLDKEFQRDHTLAVGEGVVGRAARDRRSVETTDVLRDSEIELSPEARTRIESQGSRAIAAVPLLATDRVLGVLAIYHPVGFRLPAEEREFLETLAAHAAVALENARLFADARRRQQTAEALASVTQTLTGSLDLRTVLASVADGVRELFGADGGAIGLVTRRGTMRLAARVGLGADTLRHLVVIPGQGLTGWVLRHGQPFCTADYARDPRIAQTLIPEIEQAGIRGVLAVPVWLQDEVVGILYGFWSRPIEHTDEHVSLATGLARVVAFAVANARLYQEARDREAEARALFEVGRLISSTLDPDRVFDRIVERVLELMHVRACAIFRLDTDGLLRHERGAGLSQKFVREIAVALGDGTSGRSVAERRPVWTTEIVGSDMVRSDSVRRLVEHEGYRAALSVPIVAQGAPFGCLATYWWEPHDPTAAEVQTLTSLATLAAVAIENARLYDATRHQVEQLERLNHVNRAVSASLRLDDVLDEITRAAGMLCDAPLATVWLADETERILVRRAFHGAREIREQLPERLVFGQGGVGVVAERREVQLNVPVEANPRIVARETLLAHGVHTFSGLPVMLGDRLLGVLAVSGRVGRPHGPADEALLQALVGQAAVAIQNARLYEEARAHEVEAQRALDELRRTQEQLVRAEKLRALGEMASGVAHDFNNVLAVILGRVQLLQRKVEDSTFRRWLAIVEQAALDGAQTVRQIQEFTRVRRDQPTQTVDLNQAARDAVEATRARWRDESHARGVEIHLALELGAVPPVDGQALELREVVTNLILNAVDALPRGGRIRIVTREHAGRVEMSVADTGVGMSDAVRRRIFEPFFSTKGPRGTGLGLAMVYGIVSRHGGEVLVDTTEGVGSTFTIRLPVGRLPPSDVARASAPGPASVRVLVIDDEPFVRETLEEILRLQQHDVVVADDGLSGLARFREGAFDLVMTDLAMPGMSGWQVAQAVKTARPQVPVVLVTGWGVEVQADDLKRHGVDRVLTKPFRFEDVRDVLAGVRSA